MLREALPQARKIKPYHCYVCGRRYFRRNLMVIWSIMQQASGDIVYARRETRLCLDCEARDVRRFLNVTQPKGEPSTKPEPVMPTAPAVKRVKP